MYGKECSPEETILKIKEIMKRSGIVIEEVSWEHPVPYVWSVHIRDKNCHVISVNGKGTTRALALASALGEFMERVITGYSFSDFALVGLSPQKKFLFSPDEKWFIPGGLRRTKGFLIPKLYDLYDPVKELKDEDLVDRMSGGCGKNLICTLPFERTRDKKIIYFPISVLDNLYASNGMAAGNTKEEACVQALSEVLERYVKTNIIRKGIALPDIPEDRYSSFHQVGKALDGLKQAGFRVLVKDASFGGRYPVVNVTIVEKGTRKCFLAFGAHPSFEIALTRTVTELLQGQKVRAFRGLKKPKKNKEEVREPSNLVSHFIDSSGVVSEDFFKRKPAHYFSQVDFIGTRKEEEQFLLSIFRKSKKDVYVNGVSIDGFYVCRIIVPGWSEVYPSEDLVYANNNRGQLFVKHVFNLPICNKKKLNELLFLIDEGNIGENEIVADVLGIAIDDGSPWERLCFGELKLLILLAVSKKNLARIQLSWCFDVGCVQRELYDVYECLEYFLDGKDTDSFMKSTVFRAQELFNSKGVFRELFSCNGVMRGIQTHKKILGVFKKSRKMFDNHQGLVSS